MKRCSSCGVDKPSGAFSLRRQSKDGLQHRCKECSAILNRVYHQRNAEKLREGGRGEKICPRCGVAKSGARFSLNRTTSDGLQAWCKDCLVEKARCNNLRHLCQEHGLPPEAIARLQAGPCDICGAAKPGGRGSFSVDHDHLTGEVRGSLCHSCNTALGHFRDDPQLLRAAARYVEKHNALLEMRAHLKGGGDE